MATLPAPVKNPLAWGPDPHRQAEAKRRAEEMPRTTDGTFRKKSGRPMQEVAALVLCKSELFFQTAIGETVKTEYPCGPEGAQRAADELGLEWREEQSEAAEHERDPPRS